MSTPPRRLKANLKGLSNVSPAKTTQQPHGELIPATSQRIFKDCRYCDREHPLRKCFRFRRLSVYERLKVVRRLGYCYNCLAHSHTVRKCKSRDRCKICLDEHHTLLHQETKTVRPQAKPLHLTNKRRTVRRNSHHRTHPPEKTQITTSRLSPSSNGAPTIVININSK